MCAIEGGSLASVDVLERDGLSLFIRDSCDSGEDVVLGIVVCDLKGIGEGVLREGHFSDVVILEERVLGGDGGEDCISVVIHCLDLGHAVRRSDSLAILLSGLHAYSSDALLDRVHLHDLRCLASSIVVHNSHELLAAYLISEDRFGHIGIGLHCGSGRKLSLQHLILLHQD